MGKYTISMTDDQREVFRRMMEKIPRKPNVGDMQSTDLISEIAGELYDVIPAANIPELITEESLASLEVMLELISGILLFDSAQAAAILMSAQDHPDDTALVEASKQINRLTIYTVNSMTRLIYANGFREGELYASRQDKKQDR